MEEHAGRAEFRVAYPAPDGVLITNRDSAVVAPTGCVSIADLSRLVCRGAGLQYFASLNVASAMTQLVRWGHMTTALPPPDHSLQILVTDEFGHLLTTSSGRDYWQVN